MKTPSTSQAEADMILRAHRSRLDDCDEKILCCLRDRFSIIRDVAESKHQWRIPVMQDGRVSTVIEKAREFAASNDLSPELFEAIYRLLIAESCQVEDDVISALEGRPASGGEG